MATSSGVDMTGHMPTGQFMAMVASVKYLQATLEMVHYNELAPFLGVRTPQDHYALRGYVNALLGAIEPTARNIASQAPEAQAPHLKLVQGEAKDAKG